MDWVIPYQEPPQLNMVGSLVYWEPVQEDTQLKYQYRFAHATDTTFSYLEISSDDGNTWNPLRTFSKESGWRQAQEDLSAYAGKIVSIRFRLLAMGSIYTSSGAGLFVDDFTLMNAVEDNLTNVGETTQNQWNPTPDNGLYLVAVCHKVLGVNGERSVPIVVNSSLPYMFDEVCDGLDNDGDGLIDEEDAEGCKTYYKDADGDDYGVSEAKSILKREIS